MKMGLALYSLVNKVLDSNNSLTLKLVSSVLGPFFLYIYISDLPLNANLIKMIMYTDDTTIFCDINTILKLEVTLNAELLNITDCLAAYILSLNASKTIVLMVFCSG